MLSLLTAVITTITLTSALSIPQSSTNQPTTGGTTPLYPNCTEVTFYQGTIETASNTATCGIEVSNGTMDAEYCNKLCTAGISIAAAPNNLCTFTLFTGSASCDTNDGGEKISHPIPAGGEGVCVSTGVEDGCDFQFASGVWSCR